MTGTTNLIISILVPLVFVIGMILIIIFKRRIRCFKTLIKILIYIVHIAATALAITYFSISSIDFGEFFRKLFSLYFPIILIVFSYILSLRNTIPTLFLVSVELTIIHTEIETTQVPLIIVLSFFFLVFHSFIYAHYFNFDNKSLRLEEESDYLEHLIFFWIFVQIYCWAIYSTMTKDVFQIMLACFIPIFFGIPFGLVSIQIDDMNITPKIIIGKFCISLHVIMCIVLAYIKNNLTVSVITPIFTSYIIFFYHILFLIVLEKRKDGPDECIDDGDAYIIDRKKKTAKLIRKGKRNNYIKESFVFEEIEFKIKNFDQHIWFYNTIPSNLIIQNRAFVRKFVRFGFEVQVITFDYDINYKEMIYFLKNVWKLKNLMVTDKCKAFATSSNKLFSRKMDLHFCRKDSYHLLINESCQCIKKKACYRCINLRSIKFPDSLIMINNEAFKNCEKLRKIKFGKDSQLQHIGYEAFAKTDLRIVSFPKMLSSIGNKAFGKCKNLRKVIFPDTSSMTTLFFSSFDETNISFEIPRTVYIYGYRCKSKLRINISSTNIFKNIVSLE